MCWHRVLLKDIQPLASHSNHPGLDHSFQDPDVVVSGHPEAIGEEVWGHDVFMMSKGATLVMNLGLLMASECRLWVFLSPVKVSGSSQACFKLLFNSTNKVLVVIEKINNLSSPAGVEGLDDGVPFRYILRHSVEYS